MFLRDAILDKNSDLWWSPWMFAVCKNAMCMNASEWWNCFCDNFTRGWKNRFRLCECTLFSDIAFVRAGVCVCEWVSDREKTECLRAFVEGSCWGKQENMKHVTNVWYALSCLFLAMSAWMWIWCRCWTLLFICALCLCLLTPHLSLSPPPPSLNVQYLLQVSLH